MLIEDIEKLIKQLQEEQGMTQDEVRKEAFRRALEDIDNDFEVKRGFDRPLTGRPVRGLSVFHFFDLKDDLEDDTEPEGDVAWENDVKPSERKGFIRRIIDKFCKGENTDDFEF